MGIFKKISLYICFSLISFNISAVIIDSEQKINKDLIEFKIKDEDFNIFKWDYRLCVINITKLGYYKDEQENMDYLVEALEKIDFNTLSNKNKKSYNKFANLINRYLED
jgi:hypothetical protein